LIGIAAGSRDGLLAGAVEDGEARVLREAGVGVGEGAAVEGGAAVGADLAHVDAVGAEAEHKTLSIDDGRLSIESKASGEFTTEDTEEKHRSFAALRMTSIESSVTGEMPVLRAMR
jgi:hypothetical protein